MCFMRSIEYDQAERYNFLTIGRMFLVVCRCWFNALEILLILFQEWVFRRDSFPSKVASSVLPVGLVINMVYGEKQ
jgi:hypothetical protein